MSGTNFFEGRRSGSFTRFDLDRNGAIQAGVSGAVYLPHPAFGWRCLAYIENGTCKLISRKQNQFKSFGPLTAALTKLKVQNAIIDAEVVCLDAKGKSVFLDLKRPRKANAILYCFDLLWLNNENLRGTFP